MLVPCTSFFYRRFFVRFQKICSIRTPILVYQSVYQYTSIGSVQDEGYPSTYIDIKKTKKKRTEKKQREKSCGHAKRQKEASPRPSVIHLSWLFHSIDACYYSSKCSIMDNQWYLSMERACQLAQWLSACPIDVSNGSLSPEISQY